MIAESLARTGFEDVTLIDFDIVKKHNLDRLNYATRRDIGRLKVGVLANYLRERATAANFKVYPVEAAVYEKKAIGQRWIAIFSFLVWTGHGAGMSST